MGDAGRGSREYLNALSFLLWKSKPLCLRQHPCITPVVAMERLRLLDTFLHQHYPLFSMLPKCICAYVLQGVSSSWKVPALGSFIRLPALQYHRFHHRPRVFVKQAAPSHRSLCYGV